MERFKEIVLLSLAKVLREHLVTVFQYLRGRQKKDGVSLHKGPHGEDKWQWVQVSGERFHVNIRKNFFTMRTIIN